jgi:hypothetical protein
MAARDALLISDVPMVSGKWSDLALSLGQKFGSEKSIKFGVHCLLAAQSVGTRSLSF